jgi:hypothetical protein
VTVGTSVSDLVVAMVDASAAAIALHFERLYADQGCASFEDEHSLGVRLEAGWDHDLRDALRAEALGFPHAAISDVFADRLRRAVGPGPGKGRRLDRHIWAADYDRKIQSLFPAGARGGRNNSEDEAGLPSSGRTRVSSILQQALLRSRRILQAEKAQMATHDLRHEPASAFCPSPFYVAQRILSNPQSPATEVYARAAIRTLLADRVASRDGRSLKLDYDTVSRALEEISVRAAASKSVQQARLLSNREAVFLRHYLAAQGILVIEIDWTEASPWARIDRLLRTPDGLFMLPEAGELGRHVSFRLHPRYSDLPDAGMLLNELEGLPLPIEGMSEIFQGGLRFAASGEVVAAVSGPFGAGKTSACLALAASLAPLGCRTLFLSCEEEPADITMRLREAAPGHLARCSSLFRSVRAHQIGSDRLDGWFRAHKLRVEEDDGTGIDVAVALTSLIDEALNEASLFHPFHAGSRSDGELPSFARPLIIVDGFHQLFLETKTSGPGIEGSLRRLIDLCRRMRAVFLFTVGEAETVIRRLDYLCDLVLQFDRRGFDMPESRAERIFRLLKARRQPAISGAHVLHLSGPRSFRLKPNASTYAQRGKLRRWAEPDVASILRLSDTWDDVHLQSGTQSLIYGYGSSGKAGLGLYILHRRPVPASSLIRREPDLFAPGRHPSEAPLVALHSYESRILVVSFLYHATYYRRLARRIRNPPASRSDRASSAADSMLLDVMALYPGNLTPDDFLAKIDNRLWAADTRGLPYTGVMIDGTHNVYVQFPALQAETTFWPQLYSEFRRRGINVVTTHTDFELRSAGHTGQPSIDFEHARQRAAPLMSALVSAADYTFELSAVGTPSHTAYEYRLYARDTLGAEPPNGFATWNRQTCRLGEWQSRFPV